MTDWNDLPDEMRRLRLDEDTVDRLLAGGINPDDAPPGYSEVARVLQAATAADLQEELAHEAVHVGLAMELVKQPSPASTPSVGRSKKMGSRSRRIKVGGLVVVGALVGSTALERPSVRPMDFTGRPMRGFVFVGPEALGTDRKLRSWVMRGARYAGGLPRKPAKGAR